MKTHSFFMKLFLSLVGLVVIPVSIVYGIAVHRVTMSSKWEIGRNCVSNLETADKSVEQFEDSIRKDCLNLSRSDAITKMAVYGSTFDLSDCNEMLDVCKVLDTMVKTVQTDDKYYSAYLYLENFPYYFTTDRDMVPGSSMTDLQWKSYYTRYKEQKIPISFTTTHTLSTDSLGQASDFIYLISYVYPLTPYTTPLQGALVVNVKENRLSQMVNNATSTADGSVLIIDGTGNVISSVDTRMLSRNIAKKDYIVRVLQSKVSSGYFPYQIDSKEYLISYYKSDRNGWTYVGLEPSDSLVSAQRAIQGEMALAAGIILLIGTLIAYMASRKIYSPVETMVRTIRSNKMLDLPEGGDEFSIIFKVLTKAMNTIGKGGGKYRKTEQKELRENAVLHLIGGDLPVGEGHDALTEYFDEGGFLCAVVSVDRYGEAEEPDGDKRWGYLKTVLMELADEVLGPDIRHIGCTLKKGEITLVCNMRESRPDECVARLEGSFGQFQTELGKMLDNTVTVGIGRYGAEMAHIRGSYLEAEAAVRQKLKLGLGRIIPWNDEWNQTVYYYPFETEEAIRSLLELGMQEELAAKVTELTENLRDHPQLSCENIIQIVNQLVGNTITKYMIDHHISSAEVYGADYNVYSAFADVETLEEIRDMLIRNYAMLTDYSRQAKCRSKGITGIIEYIRGHYKEDIGISDIAEHVGLSYSHVRKIFKDELNVNIVDYINSMRIREAKHLLAGGEDSIKSIAASLGYNNDQSFERYFKKLVGMTPGEFRSRMHGDRQTDAHTS